MNDATPKLLTQIDMERKMYYGGIKRSMDMLEQAQDNGRAGDAPYAKEIFRDYVIPLAAAIKADLATSHPGSKRAHAELLNGLDLEAVSFLSIRYIFSTQLSTNPELHRGLLSGIGRTIHQELLLAQVENYSPELYHTLVRDMGRRLSKDERYRVTVMRMQAQKAGIVFTEWPLGARQQVGSYMLDMICKAGLITIGDELRYGFKRSEREVYIAPDILDRIDQIKQYVALSMPMYGPCVEPPRDWVKPYGGGYHTKELQRANPFLVRGGSAVREAVRDADMPIVLKAVNALQRTGWRVNERMLDTLYEVAKNFSTKEVVSLNDKPKPTPPIWLEKGMEKGDMDEARQEEFKHWKRTVADWHTERKLLSTAYGRFYSATRQAEELRHYPALYFVYFADSRGRLYPMTYGLSPQGSDLGKSLLTFSKGMPVTTPDAIRWFHVHGANKWGFDKATLKERHDWVVARQDEFVAYANDPINVRGWTEASDPMQFLAWCFEYRDWLADTDGSFLSKLPISMDGSCNGLQNLSALFRDEVGGKATNLTNNAVMEDIYRRVAEAALVRLNALTDLSEEDEDFRKRWLSHGINRKIVKRSVMTTPYGVTLMSARDYIISDYLAQGEAPGLFDKPEYKRACSVLMKAVWPAIGDVVVKGREAMDWLKRGAKYIINAIPGESEPIIVWETPSGFRATQAYFDVKVHRINTRLQGPVKIRILSETDEPSLSKHSYGLAPNFVHSMDAAHLHLTTASAAQRGITDLAMIHDDYGTHAANSQSLFEIIRREFVSMYDNNDPIEDLVKRYPVLPKAPTKGTLDIREVLHSDYFFS